ncbi:MAG: HNH endonuclease signature motif containing protein [Bdellovibrionota bacterium]
MIPLPLRRQKQFLLHTRAIECATKYRKLEGELLDLIQQIDTQKLFRDLGYSSLFTYLVSALRLSESQAFNFINVARKATEVPALKTQILSGALSVSKARKIVPVLTTANQQEWIPKAIALPQKEIERQVADTQPSLKIPERLSPKTAGRTELRCGLSVEVEAKLKRAQDLLSTRKRRGVSLEETLEEVLEYYLRKKDPVRKARGKQLRRSERQTATNTRTPIPKRSTAAPLIELSKPVARQVNEPRPRRTRYLPAPVRQTVNARDEGRCRYREPDGKRCRHTRWVEIHHLHEFSRGGPHEAPNLITLCHAHHGFVHRYRA